jgi:hypothetical protein
MYRLRVYLREMATWVEVDAWYESLREAVEKAKRFEALSGLDLATAVIDAAGHRYYLGSNYLSLAANREPEGLMET